MKRNIKWVLTITLLIIVVVLVYYKAINNTTSSAASSDEMSDMDNLLNKDYATDFPDTVEDAMEKINTDKIDKEMEENYPLTVCQVVQLFTRIQKCYYNEKCSETELIKLAYMATILFDEELVENNPFDVYISDLQEEIKLYNKANKIISRVILGKSSDVTYSTVEGEKYASVECVYYVQDDTTTAKNITTYILRKNEDGKWKILGWQEYQPSEWEE